MTVVIQYTRKALKGREGLTQNERSILDALEQDLREQPESLWGVAGQVLALCGSTERTPTIVT